MTNVTIITGASRGIGAAAAKLCADAGHAVCVNYQASAEKAEAVVAEIVAADGKAIAVQANTANEADVMRLFDTAQAELGAISGLVNNAGVHGPRGRLDDLSVAEIEDVLDVNVLGCFLCAREAVKRMSTKHGGQGGAIVNISSGAATAGGPNDGILYAASKGAVNSLTIGLAQEVAGEGIRVNTVAPGLTETDMPGEKLKTLGPGLPMGRPGQPIEVAEAIVWLLTDKASYVSGANLRVGGGKP
ncbi:MAG: SDR family oxidoreductase [Rhodospirillaceae bacterium]|nr:SDR family oxidoreductase [Rhodospirillaceae bacterium]MBT5296865.1 SDR family oxidoreductase [Rhodospirillaceae bacterium]MBT6610224.1 SDR family oxidoreductase [Rhodospirillaceae bacterium]